MRRSGQSITEYAILFGVVTAALVGMQVFAKRGIQAGIKTMADRMSPYPATEDPTGDRAQLDGIRFESGDRRTQVFAEGAILDRQAALRTQVSQAQTVDLVAGGGQTRTVQDTTTQTGALGGGVSTRSEVVANVE